MKMNNALGPLNIAWVKMQLLKTVHAQPVNLYNYFYFYNILGHIL
jgi:hypothetical protein